MADWSNHLYIKQMLLHKWDTGQILRNALYDEGLFPYSIKLKGPTSEEMSTKLSQIPEWIAALKRHDKNSCGYGYSLVEKEVNHRLVGKNTIPTHAVIPSLLDAVRLLEKQAALRLFEQNSSALLREWKCLYDWILKHPFHVVTMGENSPAVLQVLHWFSQHERRNLYLRQLDIEGVDTKFIETHKPLFSQLLDVVLPSEQINFESSNFELRYGLKNKPKLIRLRILDEDAAPYGCCDITLPLEQLCRLQPSFTRVFIVENEINFLSFPSIPSSVVIFGGGYRAELLKCIPWLCDKEIFYWGDIDTHGFNILCMVRKYLPQTQSFLMSEDILLSHRSMWVREESPYLSELTYLTPPEYALFCNLRSNRWGEGVRLEQERIRFSKVARFVEMLFEK